MNIKENSSYIKGLLEGLSIDAAKPEGRIISALVDVIDKMAEEIECLKADVETCNDYIEEIDEDLGSLEEFVYDLDDCDCDCDDDCDCCCDDDDCDCCCCDDDDEDGDFYCAMCPSCGEKIYFDESCDPEKVICPSCQKPLISDTDEESED